MHELEQALKTRPSGTAALLNIAMICAEPVECRKRFPCSQHLKCQPTARSSQTFIPERLKCICENSTDAGSGRLNWTADLHSNWLTFVRL